MEDTPATLKEELTKNVGWYIALGIGMIILGLFAIFLPFVATFAIENLIGILFDIAGIMLIIHAFRWRRRSGRFITDLVLGVIYLIFGILLLSHPLSGVVTLTSFLIAFFLIEGIFKIIQSFRMRPTSNWGWTLFSGIVSVVLAFIIWGRMPFAALWAIGIIVGIDLLFSGWAVLTISLSLRSAEKKGEKFCIGGECVQF